MRQATIQRQVGERLRELRKVRGLTQEGLAERADVDRGFISEMEVGDRNPSIWVIYRLASGLGVQPSELLPDYED